MRRRKPAARRRTRCRSRRKWSGWRSCLRKQGSSRASAARSCRCAWRSSGFARSSRACRRRGRRGGCARPWRSAGRRFMPCARRSAGGRRRSPGWRSDWTGRSRSRRLTKRPSGAWTRRPSGSTGSCGDCATRRRWSSRCPRRFTVLKSPWEPQASRPND